MRIPVNAHLPRLPIALATALVLIATDLGAQQSNLQLSDKALGEVEFSLSCSAEAQAQFEHSLAQLHDMMYRQAEQTFTAITEMEPGCAMPHWSHAIHIPSLIFVKLGLWEDTISWNQRSAAAAKRLSVDGATSTLYVHAVDYLVYAYLQRGEDQSAWQMVEELNAVASFQDSFGGAYGVAAAQARYRLERAQWAEAAALPVRVPSIGRWDKYPAAEAISHFARGLGGARSGNMTLAREAIVILDNLHRRLKGAQQDYWAVLVDAQRLAVSAWVNYAEGNHDQALQLMTQAAELEDSVAKHPVTLGAVLPARELLGDMLALLNRPSEAIAAYEAALVISPNRFRSLFGAWQVAEWFGNQSQAKRYSSKLQTLIATAHNDRPEMGFFAGNPNMLHFTFCPN